MYKLKDNVTDEMLKSVGFNNNSYGGLHRNTGYGTAVFVDSKTKIIYIKDTTLNGYETTEVHSCYIRDLLDKGWLELI